MLTGGEEHASGRVHRDAGRVHVAIQADDTLHQDLIALVGYLSLEEHFAWPSVSRAWKRRLGCFVVVNPEDYQGGPPCIPHLV